MKDKFLDLAERFDAMAYRERVTIAAAVLIGGLLLGYLLLVDPQLTRQTVQTKRISQIKNELASLETQMSAIQSQLKDPDASNRGALQEVRKRMAAIDMRLRNIQDRLVMPDKMQAFLEGLLARNRKLELLSLRTLPPAPLIDQPEPGKKADGKDKDAKEIRAIRKPVSVSGDISVTNIYKHAIEIRIAGSYNDLLTYLAELEEMPQRMMWGSIELTVEKHPRCVLTLTVYTLSLDKQWLVV